MSRITKSLLDGNNGRSNGNGKPAKISQKISKHLLKLRGELKPRPRNPYRDSDEATGTNGEDDDSIPTPRKRTRRKKKKGKKSPRSAPPLTDAWKQAIEAKKAEAKAKKAKLKGKGKASPKSTKPARADAGDGQSVPKPKIKPKAKRKRTSKREPCPKPKDEDDELVPMTGESWDDLGEPEEVEEVQEVQESGATSKPRIENEPPFVFVPLWIIKTIGANTAAILIAQTFYWLSPARGRRTRLKPTPKDGRSWTPSCREITEQTGLTRRQIDGALAILVRRKRIEHHKTPGSRRRVIRLEKRFHARLLSKGHLTEMSNGYGGPGLKVRAAEVAVTSSIPQALVLASILWWWEPNADGKSKLTLRDPEDEGGYAWRYCTISQVAAETGLSPSQVKTALRRLRHNGLIVTRKETRRSSSTGDLMTMLHVRPNFAALDQQHRKQTGE